MFVCTARVSEQQMERDREKVTTRQRNEMVWIAADSYDDGDRDTKLTMKNSARRKSARRRLPSKLAAGYEIVRGEKQTSDKDEVATWGGV